MSESLDIVAEEMRHREQIQDDQIQSLATKSSFLFTAGTTSIGASAAVVGIFLDRTEPNAWTLFWPGITAAGAYLWLVVSFFQSYRVRSFTRTPDPLRLSEYVDKPANEAKDLIADGRRYAIQCNEEILEEQSTWIGREITSLIVEIAALAATLVTLAFI